MSQCKHCHSYAINIDPEEIVCDVCYYKVPLIDLAYQLENNIEIYKISLRNTPPINKKDIRLLLIESLKEYLDPIHNVLFNTKKE